MAEHPAREALEQTVEAVVEKYAPVAVLLFGSLARGDFSPESDADVLVLLPQPRVDFVEMLGKIKACDRSGLIDLFPYGWRQFMAMFRDYNLLALDAMADGVLLYLGDGTKWRVIRREAAKVLREVEAIEGGWQVKASMTKKDFPARPKA
ncbi:MAG: nucleotidyltransferase domain-containing protein [Clostridia bacterium]|nr:nucleotidyltransferase domain-containing protein [Clostridia bacterium]